MTMYVIVFLLAVPLSWPCRPEGYWSPPGEEAHNKYNHNIYFPQGHTWGGWNPPEGDDEWKRWIEMWVQYRNIDRPNSDEWDSERGPKSGWPQHWKGYGPGIDGVPPPPWAYVSESYDKPQYCFHLPKFGECFENVTRWGFNPTTLECQIFFYSGCGGNENNFVDKARCVAACVDSGAPHCENDPALNFEHMIDFEP